MKDNLLEEIRAKENKTDEEIFYWICESMRVTEELNLPRAAAWQKLVEYLDNEGFEITK